MTVLIGWDIQDITPTQPVELIGQYYQRVSQSIRDPLTVTALALEQKTASGTEQAVLVSVDIVVIEREFQEEVRAAIRTEVPGLDPRMVLLNATHTHSSICWTSPIRWWKPAPQVMSPAEIRAFLLQRIVRAVANAWQARRPGRMAAASAHAAVGYCRRPLYADGRAQMYGPVDCADFVGIEAGNDSEVRMLFSWDESGQLTGVIVNVSCPAQVMESGYAVSADFFGELRRRLQARHGEQVHLLGQVGAAGDQAPRDLPGQAKDEANYWNESGMLAIAERLDQAVATGLTAATTRQESAPVFKHSFRELQLPVRRASEEEYRTACAEVKRLVQAYPDFSTATQELFARFVEDTHAREKRQPHGPFDDKELDFVQLENAQAVIRRYETQDQAPVYSIEMHAIRLGETAFVSNPFELYTDFGHMIRARSRAQRTLVIQLAGDVGLYLPTGRAAAAGGYGSLIINGKVGPDGGRMLVEASVTAIDRLWSNGA